MVDSVSGFATVKVTDSKLGTVDGSGNGSFKQNYAVSTAKDGSVTATLEESFTATRSGSFTATAKNDEAVIGSVSGYNTVTIDGATVGDIANDKLAKETRKYQQSWENADA